MFESDNIRNINDDEIGENHIGTSAETPLRPDAFELSDQDKIAKIQDSVKIS